MRARRKRFARELRRDDLAILPRRSFLAPHAPVQKQLREFRDIAARQTDVSPVRQRDVLRRSGGTVLRGTVRVEGAKRLRIIVFVILDPAEDAPSREPERLDERDARELPHGHTGSAFDELEERREEHRVVVAAERLPGRNLAASVCLREQMTRRD